MIGPSEKKAAAKMNTFRQASPLTSREINGPEITHFEESPCSTIHQPMTDNPVNANAPYHVPVPGSPVESSRTRNEVKSASAAMIYRIAGGPWSSAGLATAKYRH